MEVHYEGANMQDESIQRVLAERGKLYMQRLLDPAVYL